MTANDLHDAAELYAEWRDRERSKTQGWEPEDVWQETQIVLVRPTHSQWWTRFEVKAAREIVYRATTMPSDGG